MANSSYQGTGSLPRELNGPGRKKKPKKAIESSQRVIKLVKGKK